MQRRTSVTYPGNRVAWALLAALVSVAAPAGAQDLPQALPAPAGDPRKGPRLEYSRGPAQCLTEVDFRNDVALWLDGVDHLAADSPDKVRVWFEKIPGGFRGTLVYTNAKGEQSEPKALTRDNCENLARWVARRVGKLVPPAPDPEPCPVCPEPSCPACRCPACPACDTSAPPAPCPAPPKPPPWRMDLSVGLNTYVAMSAFFSANVGPVVGVAGEVRGEVFGVNAELRFVLPSRAYALEPIPGATSSFPQEFDISQISALLVPCARYKYFIGCGVAQLGSVLIQNSRLDSAMLYSFGPRLGFEVPFADRFTAFGFGEVLFAPSPQGFAFVLPDPEHPGTPPANTKWKQSVASAVFGVGVSVKFR